MTPRPSARQDTGRAARPEPHRAHTAASRLERGSVSRWKPKLRAKTEFAPQMLQVGRAADAGSEPPSSLTAHTTYRDTELAAQTHAALVTARDRSPPPAALPSSPRPGPNRPAARRPPAPPPPPTATRPPSAGPRGPHSPPEDRGGAPAARTDCGGAARGARRAAVEAEQPRERPHLPPGSTTSPRREAFRAPPACSGMGRGGTDEGRALIASALSCSRARLGLFVNITHKPTGAERSVLRAGCCSGLLVWEQSTARAVRPSSPFKALPAPVLC